ncbi:HD family phosphohydrolase [Prevotella sp. OH937_COT-195]|uniref:HD family phosphohydrolase n=1 Tax=Prevotella sp. OH937_COT-195 TaxID=2491051 RepID=UPI000F64F9F1|nr:HDIG domain-containing metalloprotein [Prevotella sp. OH937_COT-195]RRC99460.1 HDIG domain-containing protein [Prevotella sp. OH937_COT-195]
MNIFKYREPHFWRNTMTRAALVAVTVAIIVWFLPKNSGPQYQYDVGKPWMYGAFIAKFDFPIYKTEEAIKAEKDSILNRFEPYYNFSDSLGEAAVKRFEHDFAEGISGMPPNTVSVIAQNLTKIYRAGVMDTHEYSENFKDTTKMVRLVSGKTAQNIGAKNIYSEMSAYEQLFIDMRLLPYRQLLQKCNLNKYIVPNIVYDSKRSETERSDMLSAVTVASGMVISGQKIIDRGEIVDDHDVLVLNSFEREMQRRHAGNDEISFTIFGQIFYVALLVFLFTLYLGLFRKDYFQSPRSIAMAYTLITFFPIIVSLMVRHNIFNIYVLPLAITPMFIRVFMDSRTAFVAHFTMVLICAVAVKYQYEFIVVELVAGLVAIYSLRELTQRAQVLRVALYVALSMSFTYLVLQITQERNVDNIDMGIIKYFSFNGVALLFAYPLMYVIEKVFGFTSAVTLVELSNTSKELLRRLSEVAPGTFQHSITVSNLAAQIADRIGAKAQLVRTGALYHDIGKMINPPFFTENQAGGVNPLSNMPCTEAAQVIISHVTEGLKLAEQDNLPREIKDFISTHHGEGKTKYFYVTYKNEHPDETIDEALFTYPGPNPFTREQAILMMADSVEAASHSLNEYTEENISELVNRIIDNHTAEGVFHDCPITFHDISLTKQVLIERLKAIYHTRIVYPELNKPNDA